MWPIVGFPSSLSVILSAVDDISHKELTVSFAAIPDLEIFAVVQLSGISLCLLWLFRGMANSRMVTEPRQLCFIVVPSCFLFFF